MGLADLAGLVGFVKYKPKNHFLQNQVFRRLAQYHRLVQLKLISPRAQTDHTTFKSKIQIVKQVSKSRLILFLSQSYAVNSFTQEPIIKLCCFTFIIGRHVCFAIRLWVTYRPVICRKSTVQTY